MWKPPAELDTPASLVEHPTAWNAPILDLERDPLHGHWTMIHRNTSNRDGVTTPQLRRELGHPVDVS
jgi:hypothetical protein